MEKIIAVILVVTAAATAYLSFFDATRVYVG
jgi:hypothetical protein